MRNVVAMLLLISTLCCRCSEARWFPGGSSGGTIKLAMQESGPLARQLDVTLDLSPPPAPGPASSSSGGVSNYQDCDQISGTECSPPGDDSFMSNKRLVPTGPNPLHN